MKSMALLAAMLRSRVVGVSHSRGCYSSTRVRHLVESTRRRRGVDSKNYKKKSPKAMLSGCSACQKSIFAPLCGFRNFRKKFLKPVYLNAKGNPDGSLSHYPSLRNLRSTGFFDNLKSGGILNASTFPISLPCPVPEALQPDKAVLRLLCGSAVPRCGRRSGRDPRS